MSQQYPALTLRSARQVLDNAIANIVHLSKGDDPMAWEHAGRYAEEIREACRVVEIELSHYRSQPQDPALEVFSLILNNFTRSHA